MMPAETVRVYFDTEYKDEILQLLAEHGVQHSSSVKPTGSINAGIDAETVRLAIEFITVSSAFLTSLAAVIAQIRGIYADVKPMIFVENKEGEELDLGD